MAGLMTMLLWATGSLVIRSPTEQESTPSGPVTPQLANATWIANVTDPSLSRDSCGSVLIGERVLWVCRDTEPYVNETTTLPLLTNSAGWTDLSPEGGPSIIRNGPVGAGSAGNNPILLMYGANVTSTSSAFYPVLDDECPPNGQCIDGSRYVLWPDQPPLITQDGGDGGTTLGYTWIANSRLINLTAENPQASSSLYQTEYDGSWTDSSQLPLVSVVDEEFWADNEIGFGTYGSLVVDGMAYLYGKLEQGLGTAMAKVSVEDVTDRSQYQYYVNGSWTDTMPAINNTAAAIPNAGTGGQGTFYYSGYFNSYVWIGQPALSVVADVYISTAPEPWGPWIEPYFLWSGPNGDNPMGAYSIQANPALLPSRDNSESYVYLTYTMQFQASTYAAYVTPLVKLYFE